MDKNINAINNEFIWLFFDVGLYKEWIRDYYDIDNLFWSLTRLFNLYWRIINEYLNYERNKVFNRSNLECDIENFIIRYKIVLDNIFYIITRVYSEYKVRWIPDYSKQGHISDFSKLYKKLENNDDVLKIHPEFVYFLKDSKEFIFDKKYFRDSITHQKWKITIYESEKLTYSFDTLKWNHFWVTKTEDWWIKHNSIDILFDINWDMYALYDILNKDLYKIFKDFFIKEWKYKELWKNPQLICPWVEIFKKINNITI